MTKSVPFSSPIQGQLKEIGEATSAYQTCFRCFKLAKKFKFECFKTVKTIKVVLAAKPVELGQNLIK